MPNHIILALSLLATGALPANGGLRNGFSKPFAWSNHAMACTLMAMKGDLWATSNFRKAPGWT